MEETLTTIVELSKQPGLELDLGNLEKVEQALSLLPRLKAELETTESSTRSRLSLQLHNAERRLREACAILSGRVGAFPSKVQEYQARQDSAIIYAVWGDS